VQDVDRVISTEIPDPKEHLVLHEIMSDHMIHGPCGSAFPKSPCMVLSRCSKQFPSPFAERTTVDADGYPVYRRRDNGVVVYKKNIPLDNGYVVPYNPMLLLKYKAHINVEWCNQSRSIKYLFKYINKGPDYITVSTSSNNQNGANAGARDEIRQWQDCRYISPQEAVWRIYSNDVHYRSVPVVRLSYHLLDEQTVVFDEDEPIDVVVDRDLIGRTKFYSWMKCNEIYPVAKKLTYAEFPGHFTWHPKKKTWKPRKRGSAIGRLYAASPSSGEHFFLECY
jgi:hypothetical protein